MCRSIRTLVEPSTRYQSMASPYGDSHQVVEVQCVPDGGQGFDCNIAPMHMYPEPYDGFFDLAWLVFTRPPSTYALYVAPCRNNTAKWMMAICDSVRSVWVFWMDTSALSDSTINRFIGFSHYLPCPLTQLILCLMHSMSFLQKWLMPIVTSLFSSTTCPNMVLWPTSHHQLRNQRTYWWWSMSGWFTSHRPNCNFRMAMSIQLPHQLQHTHRENYERTWWLFQKDKIWAMGGQHSNGGSCLYWHL